ncbi:urea ABC transporter permease subunit UrtC [Variovorax paradoxus]|jgi:urea transport system permease protein|uniref:urea ABC transporter permease subunit UrtC n=1 Tax=Variovorax paradoxus TaxID=34073 RepID=UPI0006E6A66A|nr:urea ABC transporter permease subunit UrtC [Variovorax paradoxus]KPU97281.1 urea ABC transporter permease subunit UrtC [Variovorax paradoxus]KPV13557.1 urea ABC transporter permease subunit UrtC [Variovorax paradoxus]KPV15338.1 urea ABC transporter permease subunit UrtC [Variovorax paradoxus]KPV32798.1 urea ABC transporter permease subunit UrtC [Variovorax paradoxus]
MGTPLDRRATFAAYAIFLALVALAPLVLDGFWLNRLAKYLVFGMLGIAVAMSWGYAGILNLGQGLFFGLGAYMLAMSLKMASPTSLQHGGANPVPDFMLSNAQPGATVDLCCINPGAFLWQPFQSQGFGLAMGLLLPALVAFVLGALLFRKRIAGVFVSIVTLALVLLVRLLLVDAQPITNGFNGLSDLAWLRIAGHELDPYGVSTYYLVAGVLAVVLVGARALLATRAGVILRATSGDPQRARYLGFDVAHYQTFFFALSAAIAAVAGMLYVVVAEFASPTFMDLSFSITMVVWAAVGGRASLLGACIGAILINMLEATASETQSLVEAWRVIVGLTFVLVVLYLPKGMAGWAHELLERIGQRRAGGGAP